MKSLQNKVKIIKVSKVIRLFLFVGVVLWSLAIPMALAQCLFKQPVVSGWERLNLQSSFLLIVVIQLAANLRLYRFFDRLQRGFFFDATTVAHLNIAGQWCVLLWLLELFHAEVRSQSLQEAASYAGSLSILFVGLILIFFAWLLKEAQGLQEEQELTV